MASTRNPNLIWSAGIQSLGGTKLKNRATIQVEDNLITWESSYDKCTFTRVPNSSTPECKKCSKTSEDDNSDNSSTTSGLCLQSLSGTPYLLKKRPLIITKANTQTSNCHQLITTSRHIPAPQAKRPLNGLYRAASTPNLNNKLPKKIVRSSSKIDITKGTLF